MTELPVYAVYAVYPVYLVYLVYLVYPVYPVYFRCGSTCFELMLEFVRRRSDFEEVHG